MSVNTEIGFDLDRFAQAIEERDAERQLQAYADDAEVTLVDKVTTPAAPRVLRGREQIRGWIEDVCGRDMTHRVEERVTAPDGGAFAEACRYPDGTAVLCTAVLRVEDGRIVRQVAVSAWDE